MNQETAALVERLAAKLGVTADHLWGVLITQAPIDGAVVIGFWFFIGALSYALYRLIRHAIKEKWDDVVFIFLSVAGLILLVCAIACFCTLPLTIASFANPEYWALHEILSAMRHK